MKADTIFINVKSQSDLEKQLKFSRYFLLHVGIFILFKSFTFPISTC
jgi:hypothetical protein